MFHQEMSQEAEFNKEKHDEKLFEAKYCESYQYFLKNSQYFAVINAALSKMKDSVFRN